MNKHDSVSTVHFAWPVETVRGPAAKHRLHAHARGPATAQHGALARSPAPRLQPETAAGFPQAAWAESRSNEYRPSIAIERSSVVLGRSKLPVTGSPLNPNSICSSPFSLYAAAHQT